ncbi:MAG: GntR family transcriptional regulator [Chloroflexi bacterium]|nr:GntR family transcriptional regulator [Chloroflexota bacterium]
MAGTVTSDPAAELRLPAISGHQTLEELVYVQLRRSVSAGELRPGQRISVNEAAQQLGVSRLPVIHALRRLASEGFVVIRPHRDVIVADPTPEEIRGRYLIMVALEELAGCEAVPRLDDRDLAAFRAAHAAFVAALTEEPGSSDRVSVADHAFHALLWRAAGIRQLLDLVETLWDQGGFYGALYAGVAQFARQRIGEHERIIRAIEAKDVAELGAAIRDHRLASLDRIVSLLDQRR